MKKIFKCAIAALITLILAVPNADAQRCYLDENGDPFNASTGGDCVNTVLAAVPFLRIVPDARSGAMGDVGIAISADPNAMHFNPSKLAFVEKDVAISATYTPWLRALGLTDVYMAYLTGYKQIDKIQTVGLGLRYFSLGDIAFTDENGMALGNGRPNEFELSAAYARQLSPNFAGSIGLKFIYSNLASGQFVDGVEIEAGTAVAADISMTYKKDVKLGERDGSLTLGLALTNMGAKITYTNSQNKDYLPSNIGLGSALQLELDQYNSLTFAFDINKLMVPTPIPAEIAIDDGSGQITFEPNAEYDADNNGVPDYKEDSVIGGIFGSFGDSPGGFSEELRELMYSVGVEYWYDNQFAVRAGYFNEHSTKGNRKFFTVGLGIKYNIFGLNFSYLVPTTNQRNPLDNTLRFTLLFDFGAFEADSES